MATDDCFEFGRGPCPCGQGMITVEKCIPDHPWAKESQASYTPSLLCEDCKSKYAFHLTYSGDGKSRLVLRKALEKHEQDTKSWHKALRDIDQVGDGRLDRSLVEHLPPAALAGTTIHIVDVASVTPHVVLASFPRRWPVL